MAEYTIDWHKIEIDGRQVREVEVRIPCICGCEGDLHLLFIVPSPKRVMATINHETVNLDPEAFKRAFVDILEAFGG